MNQTKRRADGVDHINIYSNGVTELGRFLSNFAFAPIQTADGPFNSIEGYWYWIGCKHPNRDRLRKAFGSNAKFLGRQLGAPDWIEDEAFKQKIKAAIEIKLQANPKFLAELRSCALPLEHYYVVGGKRFEVPKAKWVVEFLESFREIK
jgi:hypothetical protein